MAIQVEEVLLRNRMVIVVILRPGRCCIELNVLFSDRVAAVCCTGTNKQVPCKLYTSIYRRDGTKKKIVPFQRLGL